MSDYVRVRDKDTGHEYTVRAEHLNDEAHEVLDKPALDNHGDPAAMKPREPLGTTTASRGTQKNLAPATAPAQETNGRPADSEQES